MPGSLLTYFAGELCAGQNETKQFNRAFDNCNNQASRAYMIAILRRG